ncbi:voltage-gated hydrogen channel 1-like [Brevipalpus obovatus]|uniref:voltage-gated hydrogen channel 1-like n=1 Tax=Brevipalpus obovatus TaxID=246614 RepID=UPI003D9F2BB0
MSKQPKQDTANAPKGSQSASRKICGFDYKVILINLLILEICCITIESFLEMEYFIYSCCLVNIDTEMSTTRIHTAIMILRSLSLTILTIFLFEVWIHMIYTGTEFFTKPLEIMDFLIVNASFAIDVVYFNKDEAVARLIIGLVAPIRLWKTFRFIKTILELEKKLTS